MEPFFIWLEHTSYSVWVREAPTMYAFPFMLILHAIGMGFLAGMHVAICLRILGVARGIPLDAFASFFPVLWLGLAVNVFSGVSLLIAYPTKALTNPLFYVKLGLIGGALWVLRWMQRRVFGKNRWAPSSGRMAGLAIGLWFGAIFAGRLLAYTYSKLMSGE